MPDLALARRVPIGSYGVGVRGWVAWTALRALALDSAMAAVNTGSDIGSE